MSAAMNQARAEEPAIMAEPAASHENVEAEATLQLPCSRANGMTPLMHAVCDDSVDVVRTLLDSGADVNAKRNDGFTALALAAFFGRTNIVELLLDRGADVRAATRFGTSPEMWAKVRGFREVVDLLQSKCSTNFSLSSQSDKLKLVGHQTLSPAIPEQNVAVTPDEDLAVESAEEKSSLAGPPLTVPRALPEIFDPPPFVGPAFRPGHAFITRVSSDKRSLAALALALIVTLGLAILAIYQIRGLHRDDVKQTASTNNDLVVQPQPTVAQPTEAQAAPQEPGSHSEVTTADLPNKAAPGQSDGSATPATMVKPNIKILPTPRLSHSTISTRKWDRSRQIEESSQLVESETDSKPAPLTVEVSRDRNTNPAPVMNDTNPPQAHSAPLGITSSKPRTKVIQWP
jgi:hypothetical protein